VVSKFSCFNISDHLVASDGQDGIGMSSGNNLEMTPLISQAKDSVITLHYVSEMFHIFVHFVMPCFFNETHHDTITK
jgi:hypothetical protein